MKHTSTRSARRMDAMPRSESGEQHYLGQGEQERVQVGNQFVTIERDIGHDHPRPVAAPGTTAAGAPTSDETHFGTTTGARSVVCASIDGFN